MKRAVLAVAVATVLALVASASSPPGSAAGAGASAGPTAASPGAWSPLASLLTPSVTSMSPTVEPNDIDTPVTISGSGFTTDGEDGAPPAVTLGGRPLPGVVFVDDGTLTAVVPWGMDPGTYDLTVTDPGGGSATLAAAYTVTGGIGQWNGGRINGGDVRQLLLKPGDPATMYAPAYGLLGLFRSTDAGATWTYTGGDLPLGNYDLATDPNHPAWLWAYTYRGVMRSRDEGDTWSVVKATWPDGTQMDHGKVYPSPADADVVYVSSYRESLEGGVTDGAQGLMRTTDGGATWKIVPSLSGEDVLDVAFQPDDPAKAVAVTRDAKVFRSTDGGAHWTRAAGALPVATLGFEHGLAYNPNVAGEVWIVSLAPNAILKSADFTFGGWHDLTANDGGFGGTGVSFTTNGWVYVGWDRSTDGGAHWQQFTPHVVTPGPVFPDPGDASVAYLPDGTYGIQKTTDAGATWTPSNAGLTGMVCRSIDVSPASPLRVLATFGNWPGIYRSDDGAVTWSFVPIAGSNWLSLVRTDPLDARRVYAVEWGNLHVSTDGGATWADLGWNVTTPSPPQGAVYTIACDPFHAGHLLAALDTGDYLTGPGYVFSSHDFGASWQQVTMPQALRCVTDIQYDPSTEGLAFLAVGGAGSAHGDGVWRSADGGAHWARVGASLTGLRDASALTVATHPEHVVYAGTGVGADFGEYRSTDGGDTWRKSAESAGATQFLFANGDSTRLYAPNDDGLCFSADLGDHWSRAAGAFGRLQITALAATQVEGRPLLYAATNGGQASASGGAAAGPLRAARAATRTLVKAGVYRYAVVTPKARLRLGGLRNGALALGGRVTVKGTLTPAGLAGSKVALVVQRKAGRWVKAASATCTVGSRGLVSWRFRPPKRGSYHVRLTMPRTATHLAVTTSWAAFRVR